jgi:Response regulator containing CheY-like receiver, AAA-type ATPase, and DNA-binding domains
MRLLTGYNWMGNVRELEAVMERITVLSSNDVITVDDLPVELKKTSETPCTLPLWELPKEGIVFEDMERNLLMQALQKSNGIMADAAKLLGMTYRTFQYRAEKFGLKGN